MRLFMWAGPRGLVGPDAKALGIYHDDPGTTPEAELRSDACVVVNDDVEADEASGVAIQTIEGGDYAVVRHKGPYTEIPSIYEWLYHEWLPQSEHKPLRAPCFERYLNNPMDTPASDLLTEVHIPLA